MDKQFGMVVANWWRGGLFHCNPIAALGLILVVGLITRGVRTTRQAWHEWCRPAASYGLAIPNGIAISLNGLELATGERPMLPRMRVLGALWDRSADDWVLFGQSDELSPALPFDVIAVAVRSIRLHLEAPGIDIRPGGGGDPHVPTKEQAVQYFGGVENTIVGRWFFDFDTWLKRAATFGDPGDLPAEMPVYWSRAVQELEREVVECQLAGPVERVRSNRLWLCAGEISGIESENTLTFDRVGLNVLAESVSRPKVTSRRASPCTSTGTDDEIATQIAAWLTDHLGELDQRLPLAEIDAFARMTAAVSWLAERDPYRDLRPWLEGTVAPADTPRHFETSVLATERSHLVAGPQGMVRHEHRLELSGGVEVYPHFSLARASDDSLFRLRRAVLSARPGTRTAVWPFKFKP